MKRQNILLVIIGAIILCYMGFNNKYPFLTSDSYKYIDSGFSHIDQDGYTLIYGFFVAHSSWGISLWFVVFTQALILSLIIYYVFKYFSSNKNKSFIALCLMFFITFLMYFSLQIKYFR